jgi:hypothetical protein
MDPRDPRNAPPDPPLVARGYRDDPPPDPQLPRHPDEEELTARFGPVAPEPTWEKPPKPFNRERFLLYLVAWILGVQFSLLILAGLICGYGQLRNFQHRGADEAIPAACPAILEKIKESAAESLAVLLALLGGGTIAVGEYQRRHPPGDDPRDPRR